MFSNATNNYFHLDKHFYLLEFRLFTAFSNKTGRLKEISDGLSYLQRKRDLGCLKNSGLGKCGAV
ncbi:TPA: hypothetical protein ACFP4D_000215 [Neisseria subflava]